MTCSSQARDLATLAAQDAGQGKIFPFEPKWPHKLTHDSCSCEDCQSWTTNGENPIETNTPLSSKRDKCHHF